MTPRFKDHFSDRAEGYAAYRPHYPPALADYLAELAPARGTAWDAGCGSGQLSTLLGDRFTRVIATDASEAQIARAVPHPRVEYAVARAECTTIADASVDLITVAQAAHWLDLPGFYKEARRVARADAAIALVTYVHTEVDPSVDAVVEQFYSGVLGKWWAPERRHTETGYRLLDFPFSELDAPEMQMEEYWTAEQLIRYISTWSAVRAMEAVEGAEPMRKFGDQLRAAWGSDAGRRVTWPIAMRVGRVSGG